MAQEEKPAPRGELENRQVRKILEATLESGLIEDKLSLRQMMDRLGPVMADAKGYFCAWSNFVVVCKVEEPQVWE